MIENRGLRVQGENILMEANSIQDYAAKIQSLREYTDQEAKITSEEVKIIPSE